MIEVKNVCFKAEKRDILLDINLTIGDNDFAAIIGPNGAGKSTLIKVIINQIPNYTGQILIDGIDNRTWLKSNRIGYMPQRESFDRNFPGTAEDMVLLGLAANRGLFRGFNSADHKKAEEALDFIGGMHLKNKLVGNLSGGEFQRVLIARALITNSKYLFLDEPEAGVDSSSIHGFYDLLLKLNKMKKTILLISHDINMVLDHCTHLVCLNKTLHTHTRSELATSEMIQKAYGEVMHIVEKRY